MHKMLWNEYFWNYCEVSYKSWLYVVAILPNVIKDNTCFLNWSALMLYLYIYFIISLQRFPHLYPQPVRQRRNMVAAEVAQRFPRLRLQPNQKRRESIAVAVQTDMPENLIWCICRGEEYGEMIFCENPICVIHFCFTWIVWTWKQHQTVLGTAWIANSWKNAHECNPEWKKSDY